MATVASLTKKNARKNRAFFGGGKETRTPDPYAASVMLYQLSYAPTAENGATRPYAGIFDREGRVPLRNNHTAAGM